MIERSGQIEGSPALPVGLPSQPPRPLAQPGSALLPPFQAGALSSSFLFPASAPRQLTGLPANDGSCSSYSRTHFLFPPAGCAQCAGTGWSPIGLRLSSLAPHALLQARNAIHVKKALALGLAPYFSQLYRPLSLLSPCQPFWCFENVGSYIHSQKPTMWALVLSCFNCSQKLNLGLLLGKWKKLTLGTTFLFSLLLSA